MPRRPKIEVSAINLRIPVDKTRSYSDLIMGIYKSRAAVNVYGTNFLAIAYYHKESQMGIFSKYSEIDIDGDWFDIEDFGPADQDKVNEVTIPGNLRPNHSQFYFKLDEKTHILTFESYSESKNLSARSAEIYFKKVLSRNEIIRKFGRVEADVVNSYSEVDRIVSLPDLKELRIVIRRPNPDDVSGNLAAEIEKLLSEQNGGEYEEVVRSRGRGGLKPNKRTKSLAFVGVENGEVSAKSMVNGVQKDHTTDEKPEKIVKTYNKEDTDARTMFEEMASEMFQSIRKRRAAT